MLCGILLILSGIASAGTRVEREVRVDAPGGGTARGVSICEGDRCLHTIEPVGVFPAAEILTELSTGTTWLLDREAGRYAELAGLPGLDRIFALEITFLGETGTFTQQPLPRSRPPLAGPNTTYWVARDEAHHVEVWVDPDQVRSAEDFAQRLRPRIQHPETPAGVHQLAQVRALPGFPIQVRSGDGLVTTTVTRMEEVEAPEPAIPSDLRAVPAAEILGFPVPGRVQQPSLQAPPSPRAPPYPVIPASPGPDAASRRAADAAWHRAARRHAPKRADPWEEIARAPGHSRATWISADRLFSCSPRACLSWDHRGADLQEHPLACSSDDIVPSGGGRWVIYACGDVWVRWDTSTGVEDRHPRSGIGRVGEDGQITETLQEGGWWIARRGQVVRVLEIDPSQGGDPPWPGTGDVLAWTSNNSPREAVWFVDGPRVDAAGLLIPVGDRMILSHLGGGYSEVTAGGLEPLAGAPKGGWPGHGSYTEVLPLGARGVLWGFESAVALLDEELRMIGARSIPQGARPFASPDGKALFACVGSDRVWSRLEL